MRTVFQLPLYLSILALLFFAASASAQITNLSFVHQGTTFSLTSGDTMSWECNVAVGDTMTGEIWLDTDSNGVITPGTDFEYFLFTQIDGLSNPNGGPPDMDGAVNGHLIFGQAIGLVPGKYILKFSDRVSSVTGFGTVNPLPSPAHTLSGHVTPPTGRSAKWFRITARSSKSESQGRIEWQGLTDTVGNYKIHTNADTSGNPWRVKVDYSPYPTAVITPQETSFVLSNPVYTGLNFTATLPAAVVSGYIKDEFGVPLINTSVFIQRIEAHPDSLGGSFNKNTDTAGYFVIGIPASAFDGNPWRIAQPFSGDRETRANMLALGILGMIQPGDSISHNLVAYTLNSRISGTITINGHPATFPIQIFATKQDVAESWSWSDSTNGHFSIPVSNKIGPYTFRANNLPFSYRFPNVTASAGDSAVVINLTTTGVNDPTETPQQYSLHQNYPNPFNPSTIVEYDLPRAEVVWIKVFDVLGREMGVFSQGYQPAGHRSLRIDGSAWPSGVYMYRIQAGQFTDTRRMVLMK